MIFLLSGGNSAYKLIQFDRYLKQTTKIILGVDPGTLVMGHSVIAVSGNKIELLEMDVLKMKSKDDNHIRLQQIYQRIAELIEQYHPECLAIEAPFFGKNVQSMLKLGRAQGVCIAAAIGGGLEVFEYSPKKVKQSITGNGNSDKEQVWKMLQRLVPGCDAKPKYLDSSDALGVAVCHHFQGKTLQLATAPVTKKTGKTNKKSNSWEVFINNNPGKVRKK